MRITELDLNNAPERGHILAYSAKKVNFERYSSLSAICEKYANEELLELHLFDNDKELRFLSARSPKAVDGVIRALADFPEDDDDHIYRDQALLEEGRGRICVLNHIRYDENGMAVIDNYRLQVKEDL